MKFHLKLLENWFNEKQMCVEVLQLKGNKCKYWILYNLPIKYKFSKLSYTYFHPRKFVFLKNFFGVESCYKIKYVY